MVCMVWVVKVDFVLYLECTNHNSNNNSTSIDNSNMSVSVPVPVSDTASDVLPECMVSDIAVYNVVI